MTSITLVGNSNANPTSPAKFSNYFQAIMPTNIIYNFVFFLNYIPIRINSVVAI